MFPLQMKSVKMQRGDWLEATDGTLIRGSCPGADVSCRSPCPAPASSAGLKQDAFPGILKSELLEEDK